MSRHERCTALMACLFTLVLVGCGVDATGVVGGGNPVSVAAKENGADMCLVGPSGIEVVHRSGVDIGSARTLRPPRERNDPVTTLVGLLASEPTQQEQARGLSTEVPAETRLVIEGLPSLLNRMSSPPPDDTESAQPLAVNIASPLRPPPVAAEQIGCTLERYFASSGIVVRVVLRDAGGELIERAGTPEDNDLTSGR